MLRTVSKAMETIAFPDKRFISLDVTDEGEPLCDSRAPDYPTAGSPCPFVDRQQHSMSCLFRERFNAGRRTLSGSPTGDLTSLTTGVHHEHYRLYHRCALRVLQILQVCHASDA